MATKETRGSSSIPAEKSDLSPMKIALEKTVHYAKELEDGVKMLMYFKGSENPMEKEICDKIDENRANFISHFSELTDLIAKEKHIEVEVVASVVKAIGSFKKKAKEHNEAVMARIQKYQGQMKCLDSVVDAMISQLSKLADGQVSNSFIVFL